METIKAIGIVIAVVVFIAILIFLGICVLAISAGNASRNENGHQKE